jgi:hypothetical protein
MMDRIWHRVMLALALAALSLVPSQAAAAVDLFTISGNGTSASFNLNSSPIPSGTSSTDFLMSDVAGTYNGSPTTFAELFFFVSGEGGGLQLNTQFLTLYDLGGDQLFTGTTSNPTFIPGNYLMSTFGSEDHLYSLSISSSSGVPEPATWTMMMLGFGAIGLALRQRRRIATAS